MTPSLRNTHRFLWFLLPPVFALAFWAAISASPKAFEQAELYENNTPALPQLLRSHDTSDFIFNLRTGPRKNQQVEIVLKKPLIQPGALVYQLLKDSTGQEQQQFLGHLGTSGVYRFPTTPEVSTETSISLEIFDIIREERLLLAEW